LLLFGGQGFGKYLDGTFKFGQVVINGGLQNGVVCVEVTVSQVITHACDLRPGNIWLGAQQLGRQGLNSFADFQEPDTHRVEYQAIR